MKIIPVINPFFMKIIPVINPFFMKIIPVINRVCTCVRMAAEDGNFPRDGGGCVYLMILFDLRVFVLVCQT